jgi:O-antigen/teichoic acid export membrane protein
MLTKLLKNKKVLYTLIGFLPLSVSIIFTPLYINYLSVKDYGFINLYSTVIGLIAPILHLGIKDGFGFLYWQNNDSSELIDSFFKKSLSSIAILQIVTMFLFFVFGGFILGLFFESFNETYYKPFVLVAGFYAFFLNINDLFFYYFRNKGDTKNFILLNVLSLVLMTLGSILGIIVFNKGLYGAIFGKFIGYSIVVLYFTFKYFRSIEVEFDVKFIKKITYSGFPILLSSLIGAYSSICDKFFLQKYFPLNSMGIYGMALTITYLVDILLISFMHYMLPDILNKLKIRESERDIIRSIEEVFHLLSIFCFFVLAVSPVVLKLFPEDYLEVLLYIPFLCIVPFIKFLYNLNSLNFYLYKTSRVFLKVQIISSILIFLILYFLPVKLHIYGAVIIVILYNAIQLTISYLFLIKEKYFILKDKKLVILYFLVLFLLISLGVLYSMTQYLFLFFIPIFIYLFILYLTDRHFVSKFIEDLRKNVK